jgi:hypothetical protein
MSIICITQNAVNVDTGQSLAMGLDFHITGNFLGTKSDIADGSLRK